MGKRRGFTLIELMIAVAIVGILMAIAVPSYQNHLRKGRRAEAQSFLTQVQQKQQQYLLDARAYALGPTAITELGLAVPTSVATYYAVSVENSAGGSTATQPPSFTVRARPVTGGAQEKDGELTITHTGDKKRNDPSQGLVPW